MQQPCNGLVGVATVLENQPRHLEKVAHVGRFGTFAPLGCVPLQGQGGAVLEPRAVLFSHRRLSSSSTLLMRTAGVPDIRCNTATLTEPRAESVASCSPGAGRVRVFGVIMSHPPQDSFLRASFEGERS